MDERLKQAAEIENAQLDFESWKTEILFKEKQSKAKRRRVVRWTASVAACFVVAAGAAIFAVSGAGTANMAAPAAPARGSIDFAYADGDDPAENAVTTEEASVPMTAAVPQDAAAPEEAAPAPEPLTDEGADAGGTQGSMQSVAAGMSDDARNGAADAFPDMTQIVESVLPGATIVAIDEILYDNAPAYCVEVLDDHEARRIILDKDTLTVIRVE